jgi:anti-anti-sigma factor
LADAARTDPGHPVVKSTTDVADHLRLLVSRPGHAGRPGAIAGDAAEAGFGVTFSFLEAQAVLAVRGEIDFASAPELGAVVDAVIGRGHQAVVLDLAGLDFMDAAGLSVIATSAGRLDRSGGALTIRSPSPLVRKLLAITGLAEIVNVEHVSQVRSRLGAEETVTAPGRPVTLEPLRLARQLRRMAAIPADEDVLDGALRLVVALALATVAGADGVSVSLQRHGQLTTVAASDQTISAMDAEQYATGEGPCVDASVKGHWFHVESLDDETRWPAFTPKAQRLGINAILSNPLLGRDGPVGALNIYSRTAAVFAAEQQELASVIATETSVILAEAGAAVSEDQLARRIQDALRGREVIAQAQGVIMARDGVGEHNAYTTLRRSSQVTATPLRQCAQRLLDSTRRRHA